MSEQYTREKFKNQFLSADPDDAGIRVRLSGELLMVYETARPRDDIPCKRKTRSTITHFSDSCGLRMGRYLREAEAEYRIMVTLTYPADYPSDGREVKEHLRRFLQEMRRLAVDNGVLATYSSFWFLEFQNRGAPHFHIFTTHRIDYSLVAELWYNIVNSGDKKHLKAGTRVELLKAGRNGTIVYAKKYAKKQSQKQVPDDYLNVGRFWGVSGLRKVKTATCTFYKDSEHRLAVKEAKRTVFGAITEGLANGSLVRIKSGDGFRMFKINYPLSSVDWQALIIEACRHCGQFRDHHLFFDADIDTPCSIPTVRNKQTGVLLTPAEMYKLIKNGEL